MIFDNQNAAFRFLSAVDYKNKNAKVIVKPRSFCSLSYRVRSNAKISYANGVISLSDGDILFIPKGTYYERVADYDELYAVHFELFNDSNREICKYTPCDNQKFCALFERLTEVYKERKYGYTYEAAALLNKIFAHIQTERGQMTKFSPMVESALDYMGKNYKNPLLSIAEIATSAGVSEGYFRRKFLKETGISPRKKLIDIRMQKAASMLTCGFYNVSEISEAVGYSDPKYFSVAFKEHMAVSPCKYCVLKEKTEQMFKQLR